MGTKNLIHEKVNFFQRPKKQVERKLIFEILKQLENNNSGVDLELYDYVGLGSTYFVDFVFAHRYLNIKNLISLEKSQRDRFEFNKPYDFIDLKNISSTEFLVQKEWNNPEIIWLDYDDNLSLSMFDDINLICNNAKNKDIFLLTIGCTLQHDLEKRSSQIDKYKENFEQYFPPRSILKKEFTPKCFPSFISKIVFNKIHSALNNTDKKFKILFTFNYTDSSPMITIGIIFIDKFQRIRIPTLAKPYAKKELTTINIPVLTYKEKDFLDKNIDSIKKKLDEIEQDILTKSQLDSHEKKQEYIKREIKKLVPFEFSNISQLKDYLQFYKYYPQYHESFI